MKIIFYSLIILTVELVSCKSAYKATDVAMPVAYPSTRTSLEWTGTYRGLLPCADCQGIQKTITLDSNDNYRLLVKYTGKDDNPAEYTGTFRWNRDGNTITLSEIDDEQVSYFVVDNALAQLDMNGNKITGPLALNYILSKEKFAILKKYWKLTELNGKPVVTDAGFGKEPHIIFKEDQNRFTGIAGCNNLSGTYELKGINKISFSPSTVTPGDCTSMDLESNFLNALRIADKYDITEDKLVLSKAGILTLATFRIVYVKDETVRKK